MCGKRCAGSGCGEAEKRGPSRAIECELSAHKVCCGNDGGSGNYSGNGKANGKTSNGDLLHK